MSGKNQPWYFVSRLTRNDPYENARLGDRVLTVWLGQDGYYFITQDDKTSNANVYKSVPYEDIEAVWTYIYVSYSGKVNQAVGFVKYGDGDVKRVEIPVTHTPPNFLRLVVGGNDVRNEFSLPLKLNAYPGFNGQFTRPVLRIGPGSYLSGVD